MREKKYFIFLIFDVKIYCSRLAW